MEIEKLDPPGKTLRAAQDVGRKVVFCTPTITKPHPAYLAALEASVPLVVAAGWQESATWMVGCAYISAARSIMLRRALDAKADVIVFLDHDMSWEPPDMVRLLETPGDVVCGTYRFKHDKEEYMGRPYTGPNNRPMVRDDGCVQMYAIPAGFLKITRKAVNTFMRAYPSLVYGDECSPSVDLFNHGAFDGMWWGEDYAFAHRWNDKCGEIWCIPDLKLTHHDGDKAYPGNYHEFMLKPIEGGP